MLNGLMLSGTSLLERLMDSGVYARDESTYQYNPRYVTKLVRSFRSHPDILEVPNMCFYDNELQPFADKLAREKFCYWEVSTSRIDNNIYCSNMSTLYVCSFFNIFTPEQNFNKYASSNSMRLFMIGVFGSQQNS